MTKLRALISNDSW